MNDKGNEVVCGFTKSRKIHMGWGVTFSFLVAPQVAADGIDNMYGCTAPEEPRGKWCGHKIRNDSQGVFRYSPYQGSAIMHGLANAKDRLRATTHADLNFTLSIVAAEGFKNPEAPRCS